MIKYKYDVQYSSKFKKENKVVYKQPDCVFALDTDPDTIKETVMELFI